MIKGILKALYFCVPAFLKKKIEHAYSFIPFTNIFWKYKRKIDKSQWYNQKKLKELQIKKLKKSVRYVYENVPYYRKKFKSLRVNPLDINTINDLSKIPVLTKADIKNNFEDLKAKNFNKFLPILSNTSGSTEDPLELYVDKNKQKITGAFNARHLSWLGYEQWQKRAYIRYNISTVEQNHKNGLFGKKILRQDNILDLQIVRVRGNEAAILEELHEFEPEVIISTPSTFFFLAQYTQKEKIDNLQPRAIVTTSEILFFSQKNLIEKQFKCRVSDCYWGSELAVMVHECEEGNLHIDSEYGIVELLNSKGETVSAGKRGFIVATQLDNFAMPLIRYNTGDIAILSSQSCSCGRGMPLIASLEGRKQEMIVTKDGEIVGRLDSGFGNILGIELCQIIQKERGTIIVKIKKNNDFSELSRVKLTEILQKQINGNMNIEFQIVPEIYPTKTGKFQFIISEAPFVL